MASSLDAYLDDMAGGEPTGRAVAETVRHLAKAAIGLRDTIVEGGSGLGGARGAVNAGGDAQKELDVVADRLFLDAAKASPVAFYGSEEQDEAVLLNDSGRLALAIDPLDGSSNIDTCVSVGTIFSILPVEASHRADPAGVFQQPGTRQLAAGFFIYGPQLLLVLTLGKGTQTFAYLPSAGGFVLHGAALKIAPDAKEFAINASNHRHWGAAMRVYIDDCLAGAEGSRGRDFNMRWVGSMVADAYRIFLRGGIFLYPGDARKGYAKGRLRLLYEANPIAFCAEQAGGLATDGMRRILEIVPSGLHQRTPLVFGSKIEVEAVRGYLDRPDAGSAMAPRD